MKLLNHDELMSFVSKLINEYDVFAPTKNEDRINFEKISKAGDVHYDYIVTDNTASDILFPKRETLFTFKKNEKLTIEEPSLEIKPAVIFGVRPCDAAGLKRLDKLFNWDDSDSYYNKKREKSIIIGLACNTAADTCFCTSVGLHPHKKEDVDIMIYDLDGNYVVEMISKKAEPLSKYVEGKEFKDIDKLKNLSDKVILKNHFDMDKSKIDNAFDNIEFWKEQTNKCLRCGACAMSCPTCHCFDMTDNKTERCRFWDACTLKNFTKQASSFNPRAEKFRGYRQRFYHKFSFFEKRFGDTLCVGCGRCIIHCPSKVDILEIALNIPSKKNEENKTSVPDEEPVHPKTC